MFKDDEFYGKGIYYIATPEFSLYNGDWEENKQHGYGRQEMDENCYYEGQFNMGVKEGKGKLYDDVKNYTYDGDFIDDAMEG